MLGYLADVESGGETVFPNLPPPMTEAEAEAAGFSECARKGPSVKPRRGDAVLFWSIKTNGELDRGRWVPHV